MFLAFAKQKIELKILNIKKTMQFMSVKPSGTNYCNHRIRGKTLSIKTSK